ncbi:uncharacterized protein LOC128221672 [Mya arenaria]|uniref:uncharacterized protein LOC128221672 n=1 Tax=Mya arenaria TaxID=6604 RepID=UPI0022E7B8CB|nr:uncharacterized protein LOC128221672 [Mya arenaria]
MAEEIQNKKHRNWYRGAIATLITKKAVAPFTEDVISDFVEQQIVDINRINNRESGFVCRSGRVRYKTCYHAQQEGSAVFAAPSWKNTKAEEWCINSWQVAKCFFPPDGYIDVSNPGDTDFNGVINLIINCTLFEDYFNDNLTVEGNICEKAREVGRSIRHSPSLHVCNSELSGYFDALVALLSDATLQQSNQATKQALRKLRKLKASPYVTCIEGEIAEESLKSSSSDESLPKCLSDRLKQTISKEDIFWDTSDGSSNVDDGIETDRDSVGNYSSSISSENIQEDSEGEKSTADQHYDNLEPEVIKRQTSESELEQLRATEADESDLELEYTEEALMKRENKMRGSESGIYTMPSNNTSTLTIRQTPHGRRRPDSILSSLSSVYGYSTHKRGSWVEASIYGFLSVVLAFLFWILMGNVTVLLGLCINAKDYILFPGQPVMFVILMCLCTLLSRFNLALPLMIMFISAEDCPGLLGVRLVLFAYTITSGFVGLTSVRRRWGCSFYASQLTKETVTFYISQSISHLFCVLMTFTGMGSAKFEDPMGDFEVFQNPLILKVEECQNDVNSSAHNVTDEISNTIESNKTEKCVQLGSHDIQPITTVILTSVLLIALCCVYELLRRLLSRIRFQNILKICLTRLHHTPDENTNLRRRSFQLKFWAIVSGMVMGALTLDHVAIYGWCCFNTYSKVKCFTKYILLGSFLICSLLASLCSLLFTNLNMIYICLISAIISIVSFILTIVCMLVNEKESMWIFRPLHSLLHYLIRHLTRNVIYIHIILHCFILPVVLLGMFVVNNIGEQLCLTIVLLSHFISLLSLAALNHCLEKIRCKTFDNETFQLNFM